jgi:hypothetical protein
MKVKGESIGITELVGITETLGITISIGITESVGIISLGITESVGIEHFLTIYSPFFTFYLHAVRIKLQYLSIQMPLTVTSISFLSSILPLNDSRDRVFMFYQNLCIVC